MSGWSVERGSVGLLDMPVALDSWLWFEKVT